MAGLETTIVTGIVGSNDGVRTIRNTSVCNLSMAVDDIKGETVWYRVVCWGDLAETASAYATKGKEITAIGRIRTREYQRKDKKWQQVVELVADRLYLSSFQFVQMRGTVGAISPLEVKSGVKICRLRLAVDGHGKKRETEWYSIVTFGKEAERVAEFVTKGREILVRGRLSYKEYRTSRGALRQGLEILADRVVFGRKPKPETASTSAPDRRARRPNPLEF